MATSSSDQIAPSDRAEPETDDPAQRVHHHARLHGETRDPRTLCGIRMPRARPDAAELPCCPMCSSVMGATGQRCANP